MKKMTAKYLELLPQEVHASVRCKRYDIMPGVGKIFNAFV